MGNGLHHPLIQGEGGLQQSLAVAGGAGANNFRLFRQQPLEFRHRKLSRGNGIALIAPVEVIEKLAVFADHRQLGGGGAGVDAQKASAFVGSQIALAYNGLGVPGLEGVKIRLIPE